MTTKLKLLKKCPVCGSENIRLRTVTHDRHYGIIDSKYELWLCENCETLFVNPPLEPKELAELYPKEDYYSYKDFSLDNGILGKIKKILQRILIGDYTFEPILKQKKGKILDIGCGSGRKLAEARELGWSVSGVEISSVASKVGNKHGLNIFNGFLKNAKYKSEYYDYIRMNHSFEHIPNPNETLDEINRICKSGGTLFIGVPNAKSIPYSIFGKYWYYIGVPFHPFSYTPRSITILLEKHGFTVKKIRYSGNYEGLIGSLQIFINRNNGKKSNEGYIVNSVTMVLLNQLARILNLLRMGDCMEIVAVKNG